ncbi:7334_t:CDS:2, partial [Dentiscutata heterogama]
RWLKQQISPFLHMISISSLLNCCQTSHSNPPASTVPSTPPPQPSVGVYITYVRKEDAARAIAAVDGSNSDGKVLSMVCQNPNCMYLHEPGEEADSYTKEDLASVKYHLKEHANTEAHKIQLGRPPSSGPTSVFPPPHSTQQHTVKKAEPLPHRIVGPESDRGSNDEREEASALPPTASWAAKPS